MAYNYVDLSTLATMVADQSLGKLKSSTVLPRIVNRNYEPVVARQGTAVDVPVRGALSVNDKSSGNPVTLQSVVDTKKTITLDQHPEVSFVIEDPDAAMSSYDVLSGYMDDAILALAERIDGDIAALWSGFSQVIVATGGLTEAHFRQAQRYLNTAKARGQFFSVMHPDGFYEAQGIEELINRDYRGATEIPALANGSSQYLGNFVNFDVLLDQNIKTSTYRMNLFLHRDAAALVMRDLPVAPAGMGVTQVRRNEDGMSLRVTLSYNADALGIQCTVDALYGVGELRDDHAVVVKTAANPS